MSWEEDEVTKHALSQKAKAKSKSSSLLRTPRSGAQEKLSPSRVECCGVCVIRTFRREINLGCVTVATPTVQYLRTCAGTSQPLVRFKSSALAEMEGECLNVKILYFFGASVRALTFPV